MFFKRCALLEGLSERIEWWWVDGTTVIVIIDAHGFFHHGCVSPVCNSCTTNYTNKTCVKLHIETHRAAKGNTYLF